jgi:hypothetical protein
MVLYIGVFNATRHFQQYFTYIVTVNCIGGGSTRRKLPSCRFELITLVVIGTDCIGSCKSNYPIIQSRPSRLFLLDSANIHILFTNPSYFNIDWLFLLNVNIENDVVSLAYIIDNY